jgi:uncharacterized Ntn-hydrolase superfamily protein
VGFGTLSITAADPDSKDCGVAALSQMFAIGSVITQGQSDTGAATVQGWPVPEMGRRALDLLQGGHSPATVVTTLLQGDPCAESRQVAVVSAGGEVAAHTGSNCIEWAGHVVGDGFCCLGYLLPGPESLSVMADAFRSSSGPIPERLATALAAGRCALGVSWACQSASLYVTRPDSGFGWQGDRYVDIRVDGHTEPVRELEHLLLAYRASLWGRLTEPVVVLDAQLIRFIQVVLRHMGRLDGEVSGQWDEATRVGLQVFSTEIGLGWRLLPYGVTLPRTLLQSLFHRYLSDDSTRGGRSI